jgi:hypothetical protein
LREEGARLVSKRRRGAATEVGAVEEVVGGGRERGGGVGVEEEFALRWCVCDRDVGCRSYERRKVSTCGVDSDGKEGEGERGKEHRKDEEKEE